IIMKYSFTYNVSVQGPINIMNEDVYMDKLVNNEINPKQVETTYSGGPVMLGLLINDQPLIQNQDSYVTVKVYNKGKGIVLNAAKLKLTVPKENIPELSDENIISNTRMTGTAVEDSGDYYTITSETSIVGKDGLEKDENAFFTFSFKGTLPEDVIEKSTIITGELEYRYTTDKELSFPIEKVPVQ
ncbi:MAG: hypothetical protein PHU12_00195, partial [Candidatus Aenigmarchaeota archaeon]|nr:hypothetical protein [Candidatus Aenigmarchaeota archaeon]